MNNADLITQLRYYASQMRPSGLGGSGYALSADQSPLLDNSAEVIAAQETIIAAQNAKIEQIEAQDKFIEYQNKLIAELLKWIESLVRLSERNEDMQCDGR